MYREDFFIKSWFSGWYSVTGYMHGDRYILIMAPVPGLFSGENAGKYRVSI
jgi:hypothetical protein